MDQLRQRGALVALRPLHGRYRAAGPYPLAVAALHEEIAPLGIRSTTNFREIVWENDHLNFLSA